jgi:hypothetical protein
MVVGMTLKGPTVEVSKPWRSRKTPAAPAKTFSHLSRRTKTITVCARHACPKDNRSRDLP